MPVTPLASGSIVTGPGAAPPESTDEAPKALATRDPRHLGKILLEEGAVSHGNLLKAIVMRRRQNVPLERILLAKGWITEAALVHALTRQWRTASVDLLAAPPDPRLMDEIGVGICLKKAILPWRRIGGATFIATARPGDFDTFSDTLPDDYGPIKMLIASESGIHAAIMARRSTALARQAEQSVPATESCRGRDQTRVAKLTALVGLCLIAAALTTPDTLFAMLAAWAAITLLMCLVLKIAAFGAVLHKAKIDRDHLAQLEQGRTTPRQLKHQLPLISVLVPLFGEGDLAEKLVQRLSRLDYPRELTDILLVTEATDLATADKLQSVCLPRWIRVVTVPPGPVQTKPRALNYALNFCRGDIIGVWDAEDRPDPDQLHKVARGFAFANDDVACLQGKLDYFNPRSNWLARCFTIEYASWFRANLPGIARLGLVVPLGGTTVFVRRDVLEQIGGWDAWNVTEDADLGVRLARRGWRTELIDTTTEEEANCRPLPWIKQRSRWLKGYAATWAVHMRDPAALWRDLGAIRFIAFQVQFLGAVSQYLLAPLLWSFWLFTFGLPHPIADQINPGMVRALAALFMLSEVIGLAISLWSLRGTKHRHLRIWAPGMLFYFPLGCLAGWKAIYEMIAKPFYWDKTVHGIFDEAEEEAAIGPTEQPDQHRIPVIGQIGTARSHPDATACSAMSA